MELFYYSEAHHYNIDVFRNCHYYNKLLVRYNYTFLNGIALIIQVRLIYYDILVVE